VKKLTNIGFQLMTTSLVALASKKVYVLGKHYPVEVIVNLGKWVKIRDHFGKLNWIQGKDLAAKRHGIVLEPKIDIKQLPNKKGAVLATLEKGVIVELMTATSNGWIKVKHVSGIVGYIPATVLWGV